MMRENELDVLIVGESAEWEAVEYARDGLEAGIQKALIVMGHADSEEAGMEHCAEWLDQFIDEVPVIFVPAGNPLWSPE
jgi:putative NIF3 family GTP cyclohydrolase 1 type 2